MSRRREAPDISPNLTSLIDVTFLLIVFFVLVSRINEVERWEMELPQPRQALTEPPEDEHRVVINVIPAAGGAIAGYRVGVAEFDGDARGVEAMTRHLATLYATNPAININIRADRATNYEFVEPALQAVSSAARASGSSQVNARINLVVAKGG